MYDCAEAYHSAPLNHVNSLSSSINVSSEVASGWEFVGVDDVVEELGGSFGGVSLPLRSFVDATQTGVL
jgi:hypothetical protein